MKLNYLSLDPNKDYVVAKDDKGDIFVICKECSKDPVISLTLLDKLDDVIASFEKHRGYHEA